MIQLRAGAKAVIMPVQVEDAKAVSAGPKVVVTTGNVQAATQVVVSVTSRANAVKIVTPVMANAAEDFKLVN